MFPFWEYVSTNVKNELEKIVLEKIPNEKIKIACS